MSESESELDIFCVEDARGVRIDCLRKVWLGMLLIWTYSQIFRVTKYLVTLGNYVLGLGLSGGVLLWENASLPLTTVYASTITCYGSVDCNTDGQQKPHEGGLCEYSQPLCSTITTTNPLHSFLIEHRAPNATAYPVDWVSILISSLV